jgi:hypothetical protein
MHTPAVTFEVRSFGEIEDLEVDFAAADRPALVTSVLARCAAPYDAAFWWAQTIGNRIAALLHLVIVTSGRRKMELTSRCTETACQSTFELDLPLDLLVAQSPQESLIEVALEEGREVVLRRPTGEDLRVWRTHAEAHRTAPVQTMLDALCIRGVVRTEDAKLIDEAMSARDPLVDFSVLCRCPACGADNRTPVDLEGMALAHLRASQRDLLREVHEFAASYGWTEAQTLAVPRRRRAMYRELLER